ncbi:hypothetical protein DSECCO2_582080 [anaerobic digester metagenome]
MISLAIFWMAASLTEAQNSLGSIPHRFARYSAEIMEASASYSTYSPEACRASVGVKPILVMIPSSSNLRTL